MRTSLLLAFALVACSGKPPVDDDLSELQNLDVKSDAFSSHMKIVGTLAQGDTSPTARYTKTPRYRAWQLTAKGPGPLDVTVSSSDGGDAVSWLLDAKFKVLAKNDDADASTLDSHLTYALPAGRATYYIVVRDYSYASHGFVAAVAPRASGCDVGWTSNEAQPVAVSRYEALLLAYPLLSYQLYDGLEPQCLDFSSAAVRADLAADVLASNGIDWNDATPPVLQGAVKRGASDFLAALDAAEAEVVSVAGSTALKSLQFQRAYPHAAADKRSLVGDARTQPNAYLEFHLHVEAEECSQEGWVRVDTRTGEVLILRQHGC